MRDGRTIRGVCAAVCILALLALLGACGAAPGTLAVPSGRDGEGNWCFDGTVLVGRVVPFTGTLDSFGAGTPYVEQTAIDAVNAQTKENVRVSFLKAIQEKGVAISSSTDVVFLESSKKTHFFLPKEGYFGEFAAEGAGASAPAGDGQGGGVGPVHAFFTRPFGQKAGTNQRRK